MHSLWSCSLLMAQRINAFLAPLVAVARRPRLPVSVSLAPAIHDAQDAL
jgi:hypothetical protein